KPSFRDAFRRRRCLVPADGFYEWKWGDGKKKQPFALRLKDGSPFAFAGLWERWPAEDGRPVETCAILTTEANELIQPIHERMPVILRPEDYEVWLDPNIGRADLLHTLPSPQLAVAPWRTRRTPGSPAPTARPPPRSATPAWSTSIRPAPAWARATRGRTPRSYSVGATTATSASTTIPSRAVMPASSPAP